MLLRTCATAAFSLAISIVLLAQGGDPMLMSVDGKPVTRGEFEAIYKKNNKDAAVTPEALDEYMELFINYKLKVREAESIGMDTISKFQKELEGYRKQLARPYLIDRELNDQLMKEAHDRMMEEVRASHLLVQIAPDASPADTAKAWQRILQLRERIAKGEDFTSVAQSKGGSDDPSAAKNGGDLGWFSALQMVYPFESAAYNTPVGQLSQPVRTRFGYHIIRVTDRRPARGSMKAAHIMLRAGDSDDAEKAAATEKKVREIYGQVISGAITFSDAALKYSEDEGSSAKGGELPEFTTGKMIEEFEDKAFALKNDGDISEPFKTRFGWHIVRRTSASPPPTFDQAKGDLKSKIARDSRADITRKVFLEKLKQQYHYKPFAKNLKKIYPLVDSTIFKKGTTITDTLVRKEVIEGPVVHKGMRFDREINGTLKGGKLVNIRSRKHDDIALLPEDTVIVRDVQAGWNYERAKAKKLVKPVFTIDGRSYTQTDLLNYLEAKQKREAVRPIRPLVDDRFKEFVDDMILAYEDGNLEKKYDEFRMLMREYRDGILLFELTDQKVWSKAVKDSAGLQTFYLGNKDRFMWPVRYDCDIYDCADNKVADQVRELYKKKKRGKEILDVVNMNSELNLSIDAGRYNAEEKPYLAGISATGMGPTQELNGRAIMVDVRNILQPEPKSLEESRGLVTAAYQDALEKEWISQLRAKYKVEVNKDVLYSIH